MSDTYDREVSRSDLFAIGTAVLLFASTLAVVVLVLANLEPAVQGFLAVTALPDEQPFRGIAAFFVVFTPPTLYLLGGVTLWRKANVE